MKPLNLSRWAVENPSIVLFLMILIAVAGVYSYLVLGRAEDPSFTIKTMVVAAQWPGATAEEMELQVADKIEKKLQDLPLLERLDTRCMPGRMTISVNLYDYASANQIAESWYQVRKKINDIRNQLPSDLAGPFFDDEYGDVFSAIYALSGDGLQPRELKKLGEEARRRLLMVKGVDKVRLIGEQPEKVYVEFSHAKIATLGISPRNLFDSLAKQNAVNASGSIDTSADRVLMRVTGAIDGAEQIRSVPVEGGGRLVRLGDFADVHRGYEDPKTMTFRCNGKPALGVAISMSKGTNILNLGTDLSRVMSEFEKDLPLGVELTQVAFQPHVVEESVSEFLRAFFEALAIVLAVSFLSLGFRTGIVVALSVPLVLAICFVTMNIMGMNFDRITLGALIIALGLLVDDAIIAVEMMIVKMEEGMDRAKAATFAWDSTAFPMLTGTLITAAGFLPVGFARSSAGEYAGNIFWVVVIALISSWFVAVVFTPLLGYSILRIKPGAHGGSDSQHGHYHGPVYRLLRAIITFSVHYPWVILIVTSGLLAGGIWGFGKVEQQFFPQAARPELLVELRLPGNSSFQATEDAVRRLEKELLGDPNVAYFTAYTGAGPARFFLALDPDLPETGFAKFVVMTKGSEARERLRERLLGLFVEGVRFPEVRARVNRLDFGPPVGFPVQFRVVGPDPEQSLLIASRIREALRSHHAIIEPHFDWEGNNRVVRLEVDQDRARLLGLNPTEISNTLQTLLSGVLVSQLREGIETVDVVARAVPGERLSLDSIPDLNLINQSGRNIPLSQVARIRFDFESSMIRRRNREALVTVRADVLDGHQPPDVTYALLPKIREIREQLPPGYRIETGGSVEESEKANESLFGVFPTMILSMLVLLVFQLKSIAKTLLVVGIAPLAIIGVTVGLLMFHAPFGFVALLGVISLAGMDMRNSVILMDQIRADREAGMSEWEAVVESSVRRSRPVVLTAATAILAMIPLSHSVFWGPMAIAIMGGLSLATFLTLVNLPALYVVAFRVKPPVAQKPAGTPMPLLVPAGSAAVSSQV